MMFSNKQGMSNVFLMLLTLAGVGCESRGTDIQKKMQDIRNLPPLAIEPAPIFSPVPNYLYSGHQSKSPFIPTSLSHEMQIMEGKRVYPNFARPLQPLENYALEELLMKGTMRTAAGRTVALIRTPEGQVEQVQIGSYLGKNHGRIIAINPSQILLIEIISDGQDGYIERPRHIVLHAETG